MYPEPSCFVNKFSAQFIYKKYYIIKFDSERFFIITLQNFIIINFLLNEFVI